MRQKEMTVMGITRRSHGVLMLACLLACPALAGGDASLLFGETSSSEDRLDDTGTGDRTLLGAAVNLDFDQPFLVAIDLHFSSDDATRTEPTLVLGELFTEVETVEVDLGLRKRFGEERRFQPYIGGGVAWIRLEARQTASGSLGPGGALEETLLDDSDSDIGYWLNVGLRYRISERFDIGVDVRRSDANASLRPPDEEASLDLEAGGTHYALAFGYHW